uniref:Uncharacterized protein n=1 Tax=Cacopsylla melanoneura TaxID=428564 RepID=A0A8D8TRT4_9HEMI
MFSRINNKTVNTEVVNKIKIIVPNIRLRNRHSSRYFDIPRCTPTYRDSTLISAMQTFNEFSRELDLDMRMENYRETCKQILILNLTLIINPLQSSVACMSPTCKLCWVEKS